jgi:transcriptional regulator with XRE-family HTH domain
MGIADKIANAKKTNWITEEMAEADVKTTVELAKISAKIERCRLEKGMTQKEFADYMGVTQGMVSKWESREYNFTIKTLNEICYKLNITMDINMDKPCIQNDYIVIRWDEEKESKVDRNAWMHNIDIKGAIA